MKLVFEWDEAKEKTNLKKHKIGFDEGKTIFNDPFLFTFSDIEHSESEDRCVSLGLSARRRVLVLTHAERRGKNTHYQLQKGDTAGEEVL